MDVNRACGLAHFRVRIGQRVLDEHRRAREAGRGVALVDIELVLPLDRDEHPRFRRMKIEMARPKTQPGAIEARPVSAPLAKPNVLIAPGSSGLSGLASLPRVTSSTVSFVGVARI